MFVPTIALFFGLIAIAIAIRANASLRNEDRLPMQWSIRGEVNWTAPRLVGLCFIPVVSIGALIWFCFLSRMPTRPGQEHLVIPVLLLVGTMFIAVQLLHLWLVFKTLHRNKK